MTDLIEVKVSNPTPSAYMRRLAERFAPAKAIQIVEDLRQPAQHGRVEVTHAAHWLAELAA